MPELPEVECLTRAVSKVLTDGVIDCASFLRGDLRDPIDIKAFKRLVENSPIERVFRRSKYMIIETQKGLGVFHLGMSGRLIMLESDAPQFPHTHAIFTCLDRNAQRRFLHFIDPRRFGRISALKRQKWEEHAFFANLGPEPLEHSDLGKHLFSVSRNKKQPIKPFLMDASRVVGVGNIYASESLFLASIHPEKPAGTIDAVSFARLATAVRKTLKKAIQSGGSTIKDYYHPDGSAGFFALSFRVYDRTGEACKSCGSIIEQLKQAGRSTFYCPSCQKR